MCSIKSVAHSFYVKWLGDSFRFAWMKIANSLNWMWNCERCNKNASFFEDSRKGFHFYEKLWGPSTNDSITHSISVVKSGMRVWVANKVVRPCWMENTIDQQIEFAAWRQYLENVCMKMWSVENVKVLSQPYSNQASTVHSDTVCIKR